MVKSAFKQCSYQSLFQAEICDITTYITDACISQLCVTLMKYLTQAPQEGEIYLAQSFGGFRAWVWHRFSFQPCHIIAERNDGISHEVANLRLHLYKEAEKGKILQFSNNAHLDQIQGQENIVIMQRFLVYDKLSTNNNMVLLPKINGTINYTRHCTVDPHHSQWL